MGLSHHFIWKIMGFGSFGTHFLEISKGLCPSFDRILLFIYHSDGHLLVITGYKWDDTFYKWGYNWL